MSKSKIKLFAIAAVFAFLAIVISNSQSFSSKAKGDDVLTAIANYKTWTKITKKPVRGNNFQLDGGG